MADAAEPTEIRRMQADDIDAVVAIEVESNPHPWSKQQFTAELSNPGSSVDLLVADDDVAAFLCSWQVVDELQIQNVATSPRYRRQGLAAGLLQYVLNRAKKDGVVRVILEVRASNRSAQQLYEKYGFKTNGVRPAYYDDNEDALLMECLL
ncbi:MAG: ribosomal-protein-alanine N-acetyltransferase [Desulfuromonas sp.]|nr:MAG: ribosomal-protein-alanine N-acetyltransferase [Desulfuromonas sp.]